MEGTSNRFGLLIMSDSVAKRGLKGFRNDITNLPSHFHCILDRDAPENCTAVVEGVQIAIWINDVSLYPTQHKAQAFAIEDEGDSQLAREIASELQQLTLTGDINQMLATIAACIQASSENTESDTEEVMTEVEHEADIDESTEDDSGFEDDWGVCSDMKRISLVTANCNSVKASDSELLKDIQYEDAVVEAFVWIRIPVLELLQSGVFSSLEADSWGFSVESSIWITFHVMNDDDFEIRLRIAPHEAPLAEVVSSVVAKSGLLRVLENYFRKTFTRMHDNTMLSVGLFFLERLGNLSKHCSICGDMNVELPTLKPFCCSKPLCEYQYMYLDLNGELEELVISEPLVVDLLIQLAYAATRSDSLIPYPHSLAGPKGPGEEDSKKCAVKNCAEIRSLIQDIPSVADIQQWLQGGYSLKQMFATKDTRVLPLFRWIVMSNTAHIKKLDKPEQMIAGLYSAPHQFKMTISTPAKESSFQTHKVSHQGNTIFAFHGSPLSNWHSILRSGLNFDKVLNGRAYGHGIYHAFDIQTSLQYTHDRRSTAQAPGLPQSSTTAMENIVWRNRGCDLLSVVSVNEIVLDEKSFVSKTPFLVVNDPEKVQTRYLLVHKSASRVDASPNEESVIALPNVTYHEIPNQYLLRSDVHKSILIPLDTFSMQPSDAKSTEPGKLELPSYASSLTTMHLQRELRKLLKTSQDGNDIFKLDRDSLDNLYTWRVYLSNFSPTLPIAKDMERLAIENIELVIKFGPDYPHTPPFIRVVQPRFLPFSKGGGGHVTAGGSICMSLLTMVDWSPVYSIPQVLVAVHSGLSSVDPQPARIADRGSYSEREAMEAYIRVAQAHGWKVPRMNFVMEQTSKGGQLS